MIITFCGHRDFFGNEELKERMTGELLALAGQTETLFVTAADTEGSTALRRTA